MKIINLPFDLFMDEEKFHAAFADIMGFPSFYGCNWDAWIDCMSYIDEPSAGMSQVLVSPGEQIEFVVSGYTFNKEIYDSKTFHDFCICAGFVNTRFRESESKTRIIISS